MVQNINWVIRYTDAEYKFNRTLKSTFQITPTVTNYLLSGTVAEFYDGVNLSMT